MTTPWPYPWLPTPAEVEARLRELGLGPKPTQPKKQYGTRQYPKSRAAQWAEAVQKKNYFALRRLQQEYYVDYMKLPPEARQTPGGQILHRLCTTPLDQTPEAELASLPHPVPYFRK